MLPVVALATCLIIVVMESQSVAEEDEASMESKLRSFHKLIANESSGESSSLESLPTPYPWFACKRQLSASTSVLTEKFKTNFSSVNSVIMGGLKETLQLLSGDGAFCNLKERLRRWITQRQPLRISLTGGSASQITCISGSGPTYGGILQEQLTTDFTNKSCGAGPVQLSNVAQGATDSLWSSAVMDQLIDQTRRIF